MQKSELQHKTFLFMQKSLAEHRKVVNTVFYFKKYFKKLLSKANFQKIAFKTTISKNRNDIILNSS